MGMGRSTGVALAATVWVLLLASVGRAAPGPSAGVRAEVRADDSVAVEVVLTLADGAPRVLAIDLAGHDDAEGLAVVALGPDGDAPLVFESAHEGRALVVRFDAPPAGARVALRYVLTGVAERGGDADVVSWRLFRVPGGAAFARVEAMVVLPAAPLAPPVVESAAARTDRVVEGPRLSVEAIDVPPGSALGVRVALPQGAVPPVFRLGRFLKTTGGTALVPFLPLLVLALLLVTWAVRGRDPAPDAAAGATPALLPELAGTLDDERVDHRDVVAALVDLARTGSVRLEAVARDGEPGGVQVVPVRPFADLPPWRRLVAETFTRVDESGAPRVLSAGTGLPRAEVAALETAIYEGATAEGLFRTNPARERTAWSAVGVALAVLGLALLLATRSPLATVALPTALLAGLAAALLGALRTSRPGLRAALLGLAGLLLLGGLATLAPALRDSGLTWPARLGLGLLLAAPLPLLFAPAMPRRTAHGAARRASVAAIVGELGELGAAAPAGVDPLTRGARFEELLPYAVVFRARKEWVNRAAVGGVATPSWWSPSAPAGERPRYLADDRESFLATLAILSSAVGEPPLPGQGG